MEGKEKHLEAHEEEGQWRCAIFFISLYEAKIKEFNFVSLPFMAISD